MYFYESKSVVHCLCFYPGVNDSVSRLCPSWTPQEGSRPSILTYWLTANQTTNKIKLNYYFFKSWDLGDERTPPPPPTSTPPFPIPDKRQPSNEADMSHGVSHWGSTPVALITSVTLVVLLLWSLITYCHSLGPSHHYCQPSLVANESTAL